MFSIISQLLVVSNRRVTNASPRSAGNGALPPAAHTLPQTNKRAFVWKLCRPAPDREAWMPYFKYRLHWADGDDAGEAEYVEADQARRACLDRWRATVACPRCHRDR
jgi:hypothetical protein